jgi:hypothetical protein
MRNKNYLLLTCLVLLGGTILIRTVAIAQHAYNLLLQPPIGREAPTHFVAALANPDPSHASEVMVSYAVEKPNLIEHHFPETVAQSTPDAVSPAKHEVPPKIASSTDRKKVALRRHHRHQPSRFTLHRPWTMWW